MLYVLESDYKKQLELIKLYVEKLECSLVCFAYLESESKEIFGVPFSEGGKNQLYNPVTKYKNGKLANFCVVPNVPVFLKQAHMNHKAVRSIVDSFCVYLKGDQNWLVSTVGHEGMALVSDDLEAHFIGQKGFNVSKTPPAWW